MHLPEGSVTGAPRANAIYCASHSIRSVSWDARLDAVSLSMLRVWSKVSSAGFQVLAVILNMSAAAFATVYNLIRAEEYRAK